MIKFITGYFHNEIFNSKPKFKIEILPNLAIFLGNFELSFAFHTWFKFIYGSKIFGSYQISGGFRRFDDPRDRRICWKEPNVTNHKISLKSHAQNSIYFWFDILTLNLIKSERLADYSSIESRIMALREKLILTKIIISTMKNSCVWPEKKVCHWNEQCHVGIVTWRICHRREHCLLSADNVAHVRQTISCRDLHQDKNQKFIKLNIPFKLI